MARFVALVCLLALVAGCGGDDNEDAEQTVRDFVTAVNKRDADTYCDELITDDFRKKTTFATGDEASDSCKRQLKAITGLHIELVRVVGTKVDGDEATVTAVLRSEGRRMRRVYELAKDGGDWKLNGAR